MSIYPKILVHLILICTVTILVLAEEHDDIAKFNVKLSDMDGSCRLEKIINQTRCKMEERLEKLEHLLNQVIHKLNKNEPNRAYSGGNHGWTESS